MGSAKIPGGEVGLEVGFAAGNIFASPGALQTPYLFNQGDVGVVPLQEETWHVNGVFYQTEIRYELVNASKQITKLTLPEITKFARNNEFGNRKNCKILAKQIRNSKE